MNESAVYNETDLAPFHKRLAELRQIIHQDAESNKHPKAITKLLERQLNETGKFLDFISSDTKARIAAADMEYCHGDDVPSDSIVLMHDGGGGEGKMEGGIDDACESGSCLCYLEDLIRWTCMDNRGARLNLRPTSAAKIHGNILATLWRAIEQKMIE